MTKLLPPLRHLVSAALLALSLACETLPSHDIAKGQRFETTREIGAQIVLLYTDARRSEPIDVLLPEGIVLDVVADPEPGKAALGCAPAEYRSFESQYVPSRGRRKPGYRGYRVEVQAEALQVGARRLE